ncbi:ArsR family transcriptional regulator [Halobacteriales archaeon QS_3_64_16]|nr:MAG: ArsR family transcriptional regulator [Halobacteriales archaeon QS_3_64_16]
MLRADSRRRALRFLLEDPNAVSVSELADRIRAPDAGSRIRSDERTDSRLDRRIGLLHNHLPLLEGMGLIEFDRRSRTVVPTAAASALTPLLAAIRAFERHGGTD